MTITDLGDFWKIDFDGNEFTISRDGSPTAKVIDHLCGIIKGLPQCFVNAKPGEPFFVLRGQDVIASISVKKWADRAAITLGDDHPKVIEARAIASRMRKWPIRKFPD